MSANRPNASRVDSDAVSAQCRCEYPCDCGGPAAVARADRELALDALAESLRRAHLASVGVTGALPWGAIPDGPERRRWLAAAEADIAARRTEVGS